MPAKAISSRCFDGASVAAPSRLKCQILKSHVADTEHFQVKLTPVRVKKTRQNKILVPRSDSIGTEKALESPPARFAFFDGVKRDRSDSANGDHRGLFAVF